MNDMNVINYAAYMTAKKVNEDIDLKKLFDTTIHNLESVTGASNTRPELVKRFVIYLGNYILPPENTTPKLAKDMKETQQDCETTLESTTVHFDSLDELRKALNDLCVGLKPAKVTSFQNLAMSILNGKYCVPTLDDLPQPKYADFYDQLLEEAFTHKILKGSVDEA